MLPSEQDHDSNAHQSQEIPVVCVLFQTGTAQIGNPNDILFTAMCVVGSLENPRHIVCDNRIVDKSANQKCAVALFAKVGGWDALLFILLAFFSSCALARQPGFQPSGTTRSIVAELNARIGLLCNAGKDHGGRWYPFCPHTYFGIGANVPGDAAGLVA